MTREVRPMTKFLKSLNRKDLVGVEIGLMGGANSKTFFEELDMRCLYAVDVFDTCYDENGINLSGHGVLDSREVGLQCLTGSVSNLRKYLNKIVWIIDLSSGAASKIHEPLDFVYIDGNHRYEFVKEDIKAYYPKIKVGGVIGGHDFKSGEPGVCKAVVEYFGTSVKVERWDWWHIKK